MTDSARHAFNEKQLLHVHPTLARKVRAIIKDLEGHGQKPQVAQGYRDASAQAAILAAGNSTVSFSFHEATRNGKPCALACDITDVRYGSDGWDAPAEFWHLLGSSAHAHGLVWGGDWKHFNDHAHVQLLSNDMLAQVRHGYSPPET